MTHHDNDGRDPWYRELLMAVGLWLMDLAMDLGCRACDLLEWVILDASDDTLERIYTAAWWLPHHVGLLLFSVGVDGSAFSAELAESLACTPSPTHPPREAEILASLGNYDRDGQAIIARHWLPDRLLLTGPVDPSYARRAACQQLQRELLAMLIAGSLVAIAVMVPIAIGAGLGLLLYGSEWYAPIGVVVLAPVVILLLPDRARDYLLVGTAVGLVAALARVACYDASWPWYLLVVLNAAGMAAALVRRQRI